MAEVAPPAAPAPAGKVQKKKSSTPRKKPGHSARDLIMKVVTASKERKGISFVSIRKAVAAEGYDVEHNRARFKRVIMKLVETGKLVQVSGTGVSGSFKAGKAAAKTKPEKRESKAKKPTTGARKPPAGAKKPAAGAKKPAAGARKPATAGKPKAKTTPRKRPPGKQTVKATGAKSLKAKKAAGVKKRSAAAKKGGTPKKDGKRAGKKTEKRADKKAARRVEKPKAKKGKKPAKK
ncbi:uncharacterized protein LOC143314695 [Chaetodon auriga]|uniref:uncharacterized protein LOC143314695 n=1 Tax=Chaetodon auriga TaxID=39042 RepID=UPI004032B836